MYSLCNVGCDSTEFEQQFCRLQTVQHRFFLDVRVYTERRMFTNILLLENEPYDDVSVGPRPVDNCSTPYIYRYR